MIGYIDSSSFPVYTYGEMFIYPGLYNSYYMMWEPTSLSGYFSMNYDDLSSSYLFNDYNGLFTDRDGLRSYLGQSTFYSVGITYLETNVEYIYNDAASNCSLLKSINLPNCKEIRSWGFASDKSLEYISLPACEYIGGWAFESTAVSSIILPECLSISDDAFEYCSHLAYISAPKCTYIGDYVFNGCGSLSRVYIPSISRIGTRAFEECSNLKNINMNSCNWVDYRAFRGCSRLLSISVPHLEYVGSEAFYSCRTLSTVSLPAVKWISTQAFENCYSLKSVYISGTCSYIENLAFNSCSKLSAITLNISSVCKLTTDKYITAGLHFYDTPIASGTGRIYVRSSLVSAYKRASFWSEYSSQIYPINN